MPIYYGGVNKVKGFARPAIAPIKNHSQHCSHASGVAVLYCRKGDHHAKSTKSVTTTIPDVRQYLTTNKTMKKNEMRNATKMNHMRARTLRHEFQKESNHWNPATTFTPPSASGTPCSMSG